MATDYEPDDVLLSRVYHFTAPDNRPVQLTGRALLTCLAQLDWLAETRPVVNAPLWQTCYLLQRTASRMRGLRFHWSAAFAVTGSDA